MLNFLEEVYCGKNCAPQPPARSQKKSGSCHSYRMPALIDEAIPQFCCPFCFTLGRIRFNSSQPACAYDVPHVISSFPLGLIILYHLKGVLSTPSIVNFFNLLVSNQATPKGFDGIDFGRAMPENHDVVLTVKKVSALLVITSKNVFQNHRVGSFIYVDNAPHVINSFPVFCIHYNIRKELCQALSLLTFYYIVISAQKISYLLFSEYSYHLTL